MKEPIYKLPESDADRMQMHISISTGNHKLGYVPSFSTLPGNEILKTAAGDPICELVGTCGKFCEECKHDCYAVRMARGIWRSKCVPAWQRNTWILRHNQYRVYEDIVKFCNRPRSFQKEFRINVSGEIEDVKTLILFINIARACPRTKFYMYTKNEHAVVACDSITGIPENLAINISQWHNTVPNRIGLHEFVYDDHTDDEVAKLIHCPAVDKNGHSTGIKCSQCGRCMHRRDGQKTAVYAH